MQGPPARAEPNRFCKPALRQVLSWAFYLCSCHWPVNHQFCTSMHRAVLRWCQVHENHPSVSQYRDTQAPFPATPEMVPHVFHCSIYFRKNRETIAPFSLRGGALEQQAWHIAPWSRPAGWWQQATPQGSAPLSLPTPKAERRILDSSFMIHPTVPLLPLCY